MAANILVYALIGIVALAALTAFIRGRKVKWYIVYLDNNDVQVLYRTTSLWWFNDSRDRVVFLTPDGRAKVFTNRHILFFEQVASEQAGLEKIAAITRKNEAES